MFVVQNYGVAVFFTVITMLCWGSWANTQKLSPRKWPFQLFYWDYVMGVLLITFVLAITMGSFGHQGRPFFMDLTQANVVSLLWALLSGVVFNIANILLVVSIALAGMSVAFPIAIGLALVMGVIINYVMHPVGNPYFLFIGMAVVMVAIVLSAISYARMPGDKNERFKIGLIIAIICGLLMSTWFYFITASMSTNFIHPQVGKMTPYTASFVFAIGVFLSNYIWNSVFMYFPIQGSKVRYKDYFDSSLTGVGIKKLTTHAVGWLGGIIWGVGTVFSVIASGAAGPAISYGLGQCATLIAALWGVFIWKEFKGADRKTIVVLIFMFIAFLLGIFLIIRANS